MTEPLDHDGYALLRSVIPATWLAPLRAAFDAGVKPAAQWPVPRGADWRHALVDLVPQVQAVCQLPQLLAVVGTLISERFFLAQVEGREPLVGGGHQSLHRDFSAQRPGDTVVAIAYLDDYGPDNGATRIVPGSHRPALSVAPSRQNVSAAEFEFYNTSQAVQLTGFAGDILVFDADLLHAGSCNVSGARRRSLLIGYFAAPLYASHLETLTLRGIQMQACWFDPRSERSS
jgi:ectoine hydroxylase-related dioxygenase (phytanoyl-CoA dioxygenase family)